MTTNNPIQNTKKYIAGIHQFITVGTGSTSVSIPDIVSQADINTMTIQNGNIGIGTTTPTQLLDINGIAKANTFSGIGQGFAYMEALTSGTSWSIPANVYRIKVTLIGGGGGGGGAGGTTANGNGAAGGGGGSGAVCIGFYNVTPNQTLTYAIGTAGTASTASKTSNGGNGGNTTTTYGVITYTATAGAGGLASDNGYTGGNGGTATGGTLNLTGQSGGNGIGPDTANSQLVVNTGGHTALGYGYATSPNRNVNATASIGYGAGGTGANATGGTGTARAGAAGATGAVIIEY